MKQIATDCWEGHHLSLLLFFSTMKILIFVGVKIMMTKLFNIKEKVRRLELCSQLARCKGSLLRY